LDVGRVVFLSEQEESQPVQKVLNWKKRFNHHLDKENYVFFLNWKKRRNLAVNDAAITRLFAAPRHA